MMLMSSNVSGLFEVPRNDFFIPSKKPVIPATLRQDIINYLRVHPDLKPVDASKAFLDRWAGYRAEYSAEVITEVIKRL